MKSLLKHNRIRILGVVLISGLLLSLNSSSAPTPPKFLKKDVKEVCSCFKDLVKMEGKDFPKTSPYYQQTRAKAQLALTQVEKHIQEELYTQEEFSKWMKKKCPDLVKELQKLATIPSDN